MTLTASESFQLLEEGNRRFAAGEHHKTLYGSPERRAGVVSAQDPHAVILGCADSRVPAEMVFDQGLGDLFVVRVAGNIVAPSQLGSIEFAASQFGTRLVVVLGHSRCGAIQATVDALRSDAPIPSQGLRFLVDRVRPGVEPLLADGSADPDAVVARAVRANVERWVEHLRRESEILRPLIDAEGLRIVGAEYSLETGLVEWFDEA